MFREVYDMAINKVVFGNNTLIDLTSDTIGADKLLKGFTAHDASGASIVGTYEGGSVDGYTINLFASSSELYGQSIVVSYEGQRVTTIQFSNAGTASIVVQEEGAYNFAVSYGGLTYYCDVNVVSAVRTYNETIYYYLNGSTVTPINDVQIWISCADVRDKNYTTLAEVFADNQLLATIMSSENAVNYLVRSKQFIKSELVPKMTSNTTPSGEAFASSSYQDDVTTYGAWRAFDGDDTGNRSQYTKQEVNAYLGYEFEEPVTVYSLKLIGMSNLYSSRNPSGYLQGSNDGTTWENIKAINYRNAQTVTDVLSSGARYKAFRVYNSSNSSEYLQTLTLQFYTEDGVTQNQTAMSYIGASDYASDTLLSDTDWNEAIQNSEYFESVLNVKVPTMTSSTTPSGEVIGTFGATIGSTTYYGWKCFDGNDGTEGIALSTSNQIIGYMFTSSMCLKKVHLVVDNYRRWGSGAKVQGTTDGNTWVDIYTIDSVVTGLMDLIIPNNSLCRGYRIANLNAGNSGVLPSAQTIQFYGRQNGGVQTWLRKAGIIDKLYTTLAEVLSDTTTLEELIKNKDAVDYLVTCKGWAEQICADQNAMTYIGQNNYCANTLLADATWCNAICNSEYFESVLNVKVPTMTGYITPEGEVIYTSTSGSDYPWKAFNESITSGKYVDSRSDGYIGYIFPSAQKIYVADLHIHPDYYHTSMRLECSEDGVTWNNLTDFVSTPAGSNTKIITNNPSAMRYWRVYGQGAVSNYVYMYWMNFYGRKDIPEPTPVQRQTNYYPFSSQTLIGGSNLAYGGVSFSSFKLSGRDLEEIQEIKIKGRLYISRGSTQMKKCRMDYTIAGEKDGKWCFWNGTSWDITDVNITERYGNGFYDARGWVNVKEISSNVATVKSELIDLTIPISTIVASAKSNGINLEFANTFLNTAYWYGNFVEILGDSCFSLGIFAGRFANTTNAFVYYGFSVDQVNTTSDDLDTVSELANNSPQVEIEWK